MYTMLYYRNDPISCLSIAPYFYDEESDKDYVKLPELVKFQYCPIYYHTMDCDKGHWGL